LLASHGYVVFIPNYRGVNGYGWRTRETLDDWGGMALQDMLDGVDKLVADGVADPDRLGIGGWSNGGFMTEWTITHTNRFKAAIAEAAHADWATLYGSASVGWLALKDLYGASPYTNRAPYDAHSPVVLVKNVTTPTLLLHGQNDGSVPVGQAWEFYRGLRDNGVETQLLIFPNEGHGIGSSAHRTELQTRVLDRFDRHLKQAADH
jgi:dipeptidyl aminopeptidase/acylaminoacyl peptidase